MKSSKTSLTLRATLLALAVAMVAFTASAFVPSCEDELAEAYPPNAVADLGVCDSLDDVVIPQTAIADLGQFSQNLNGEWQLRSRTAEGVPTEAKNKVSRLLFDMNVPRDSRVAGAAMLVDRAAAEIVGASSPVAGYWTVEARLETDGRISFALHSEPVSDYATVSGPQTERHTFFEENDIFVSVAQNGPQLADPWDRIVVMDGSLTYISCDDAVVERYTKVSADAPTIEGASLDEYWSKVKPADAQRDKVVSLGL